MAKKNFEESLSQLEELTRQLESGSLSLEDSLKKFDEGIKLVEFCHGKLNEAQTKVDLLLGKDGALVAVPFVRESGESE